MSRLNSTPLVLKKVLPDLNILELKNENWSNLFNWRTIEKNPNETSHTVDIGGLAYIIRPPVTVVREVLCFTRDVFFSFFLFFAQRSPSSLD